MALLEVFHLEWVLGFQNPMPFPVRSFYLVFVNQDASSHVLLQCLAACHHAMLLTMMAMASTSDPAHPNKLFFLCVALAMMFHYSSRN